MASPRLCAQSRPGLGLDTSTRQDGGPGRIVGYLAPVRWYDGGGEAGTPNTAEGRDSPPGEGSLCFDAPPLYIQPIRGFPQIP